MILFDEQDAVKVTEVGEEELFRILGDLPQEAKTIILNSHYGAYLPNKIKNKFMEDKILEINEYLLENPQASLQEYVTYVDEWDNREQKLKNKRHQENIEWFEQFVGKYVTLTTEEVTIYTFVKENVFKDDTAVVGKPHIEKYNDIYNGLIYNNDNDLNCYDINSPHNKAHFNYEIELSSEEEYRRIENILIKLDKELKRIKK